MRPKGIDLSSGDQRPRANSAPAGTLNGIKLSSLKRNGLHAEHIKLLTNGKPAYKHSANGKQCNIFPYPSRCSTLNGGGKRRLSVREVVIKHKESCEVRCCRINILLITMQFVLGFAVLALGAYMAALTPSLKTRETPYWSGIPLFLAGLCGFFFCLTHEKIYSRSDTVFIVKAVCFSLSTICVFVCIVASIFPGIHGSQIARYHKCDWINQTQKSTCYCVYNLEPHSKRVYYEGLHNCEYDIASIKDYLILQCAFNAIACGVSLWLVFLLWRSRYANFHSGLRFFSYSANIPQHPWVDPSTPPYSTPETPSFHRKLSQKRLLSKNKLVGEAVAELDKGQSSEVRNGDVHCKEQCVSLMTET